MKNIKEYLEAQINLSKELSSILKNIDTLENREMEALYEKNKELLEKLDKTNIYNSKLTEDKLAKFQEKINALLNYTEIQRDTEFCGKLKELRDEAAMLSKKVDCLNDKLKTHYEVFKEKQKNEGTKKTENKEEKSSTPFEAGNAEKTVSSNTGQKIDITKNQSINSDQKIDITKNQSINSNQKINSQKTQLNNEKTKDKKTEFKIGANVLNTIGVILILIGFITFGKYIYTNFMSDIIKGIFLFTISTIVLLTGELLFKKKLPRFSQGISALGVAGLYASVIINYLVLETINSTIALIISIIITGISLLISYLDNSDVIRVLSLLGGYICLYPMKYLTGISSYVTIAILLMINIVNMCIPIKNKRFLIYSSVINVILSSAFVMSGMIEEFAVLIFLFSVLIINNFMYFYSYKEDDELYLGASFFTSLVLIVFTFYNGDILWRLMCLVVSICFYILVNNELKAIHFIHGCLMSIALIFIYGVYLGPIATLLYCAVMILSMIYLKNKKNSYLNIYAVFILILGVLDFYLGNLIESIIFVMCFTFIIWFMGDKYRNNKFLIFCKNALLGIILLKVIAQNIFENDYVFLLCAGVSIAYLIITNNIKRLKDDNIKKSNEVVMLFTIVVCSIPSRVSILILLPSIIIGFAVIFLFMGDKYVSKTSIHKYKLLVYSLYSTYAIIRLFTVVSDYDIIYNIALSVVLMIAALINVWIGFKKENIPLRKYGLILSLIVCGKLILIDFSSAEFLMKTVLFLIVGVIAVVISYIYNMLEREHKNKQE